MAPITPPRTRSSAARSSWSGPRWWPRPLGRRSRRSCPAGVGSAPVSAPTAEHLHHHRGNTLCPLSGVASESPARMLIRPPAAASRDQRRFPAASPTTSRACSSGTPEDSIVPRFPGEPADRHLAEQLPEEPAPRSFGGIHDPPRPFRCAAPVPTRSSPTTPRTSSTAAPRSTSATRTRAPGWGAANCPPRLNMFANTGNDEDQHADTASTRSRTPRRGRSSRLESRAELEPRPRSCRDLQQGPVEEAPEPRRPGSCLPMSGGKILGNLPEGARTAIHPTPPRSGTWPGVAERRLAARLLRQDRKERSNDNPAGRHRWRTAAAITARSSPHRSRRTP